MFGRETISSFRNAAQVADATGREVYNLVAEIRHDLPAITDAVTLLSARVAEALPVEGETEAAILEVKSAARAATVAFVIVGMVAATALVIAIGTASKGK